MNTETMRGQCADYARIAHVKFAVGDAVWCLYR